VGVDIRPQPRYPFRFIRGDALRPPVDLPRFDFVWASPPCQAYSIGNKWYRDHGLVSYPDLIDPVRLLLAAIPMALTAIENVPGAPIRPDLVLDGSMFPGLRVIRRRHFELNFRAPFALGFDARGNVKYHGWSSPRAGGSLCSRDHRWLKAQGRKDLANRAENQRAAMGMPWAVGRAAISQAVPPAYAEFIGRAALRSMGEVAAP
jgi:DNA (cytosine-5)-methyltransferase 1